MKKMFTKRLLGYMATAFVVTIIFIFALQTIVAQKNNQDLAKEKLEMVKEKLISNDSEIEKLTNSLGENNLAKTRAFAQILANDKTLLSDDSRLQKICDELMVNELHVIDEKGIITNSTVSAYIGFDMNSGEQSAAFMVIVDDPSIEIVQERRKMLVSIRLSPETFEKAKKLGRGYTGILSRLLDMALSNPDMVKKCL